MAEVCLELSYDDRGIALSPIDDQVKTFEAKWHSVLAPFGGAFFVKFRTETRLLCVSNLEVSTRDDSEHSQAVLSFLSTRSATDDGSDFSFGGEGFPPEFYSDLCGLIEDGYDEDNAVSLHAIVTLPGNLSGHFTGYFTVRPDGIERSFDFYEGEPGW